MRQFLCDEFPDDSGKLVIKDRNYRYLVKVLRFSNGDTLDARLPDGQLVQFYVEAILPSSAILRLGSSSKTTTQGVKSADIQNVAKVPELWLFQFLPKPQKMDLIVRQATECGVKRIIPICGEYSVKNDASGRIERWERIIREARQQSGSGIDTEITDVLAVGAAAEMWKEFSESAEKCARGGQSASADVSTTVAGTPGAGSPEADMPGADTTVTSTPSADGSTESGAALCAKQPATCAFLLDENPSAGKKSLTKIDKQNISAAALAVGCEGGISDAERTILSEAGFMPLHFTTNVLRAETAAIYGIAVIQQFLSAD